MALQDLIKAMQDPYDMGVYRTCVTNAQLIQEIKEYGESCKAQPDRLTVASRISVLNDDITPQMATYLMGESAPTTFDINQIQWWATAEAKYRLLKADALINELKRNN